MAASEAIEATEVKKTLKINSAPKIPVNRYQFCTVYEMMYSGLGGQWPQIEVTGAHRQPRTILGRVTEVTFCSKLDRLGGDVEYIHTYDNHLL